MRRSVTSRFASGERSPFIPSEDTRKHQVPWTAEHRGRKAAPAAGLPSVATQWQEPDSVTILVDGHERALLESLLE